MTRGDTKLPEHCPKIFKLRDGRLFASAGESEGGLRLLDALRKGEATPKVKNVYALLVHPDGKIECYEGARWSRTPGVEYVALGNGANFALGAMANGATARRAVRAGIKHDTHSGGRIQFVKLRKRRGKKRTNK